MLPPGTRLAERIGVDSRADAALSGATVRCPATSRDVGGDGAVSMPWRDRRDEVLSIGELVSDAIDGEDVEWLARVQFDLAADVLDVRVDGALV